MSINAETGNRGAGAPDDLLAGQPGECCLKVTHHEGDPQGEILRLNNVPVYVSRPSPEKNNGKGIIYIVDAYGIYQNAQLLADNFAAEGYVVCMPDIFMGDYLTDNMSIPDWVSRQTMEKIEPAIENTLQYMREAERVSKIGGVGYCFGGRYVTRYLGDSVNENTRIDAGFIAHPSFVTKSEFEGIKGPLSMAAAETDNIFPVESRYEAEKCLRTSGQPFQISLYSGTEHGFAVKGDRDVPAIALAQDQALSQAVAWFGYWLD